MECNKEEAIKAKEIAEQKLTGRDFESAKRFAMKAQKLYPALEGIKQLLDTLDVYICAEKRINGEIDWYRVLGVEPSADEDSIRKQYRKLALSLHPDKNKSVGADGAFQIISEAWGLLSDKVKRLAYDQRLSNKRMHVKAPDCKPSVSTNQNGYPNIQTWARNGTSHPRHASASSSPNPSTFWTLCGHCKRYILLPRAYLKKYFPCQNCHLSFFTIEMPSPPSNIQGLHSTQQQRTENPYVIGTKRDQPSNMLGVNSKNFRRNDARTQSDPYMRPIVMGLASARSGMYVKFRVSAADVERLKKKCGVTSTTDK